MITLNDNKFAANDNPLYPPVLLTRFCTYTSDLNGVYEVSFIEEGQSLPNDYEEFIWQYAKDGAEAVIQHEEKHDLWAADMDAGLPEKHTY